MVLGAILLAATGLINTETADSLRPYLWQARPILIFAEPGDPRLERQLALFTADRAALKDRRNVVIVDPGGETPLARRFRPDGFTVILVGLDGGEKYRAGRVVAPDTLSDLIDTMPMRRRELSDE